MACPLAPRRARGSGPCVEGAKPSKPTGATTVPLVREGSSPPPPSNHWLSGWDGCMLPGELWPMLLSGGFGYLGSEWWSAVQSGSWLVAVLVTMTFLCLSRFCLGLRVLERATSCVCMTFHYACGSCLCLPVCDTTTLVFATYVFSNGMPTQPC